MQTTHNNSLVNELKRCRVTTYKVLQAMGIPDTQRYLWYRKISGKQSMSYEQLMDFVTTANAFLKANKSKKEINLKLISFDIKNLLIL